MTARTSCLLALTLLPSLALPSPASARPSLQASSAPQPAAPDPQAATLDRATDLVLAKKPAEALPLLDAVIAAAERAQAGETRLTFSARSVAEALLYSTMGAAKKRDTVVLDGTYATALFFRGFALIDLDRAAEARPWLDRAIALAPMNAQFLAERGEWHKSRRDWAPAHADFAAAAAAAEFSPDDLKGFEQRRAWRGMAFVLSEQGRLDEAEALYRRCLAADPADKAAQSELEWIAEQRGKHVRS